MFVDGISIIVTKNGTLIGMITKDIVVDFKKLKLCTKSLCIPFHMRR